MGQYSEMQLFVGQVNAANDLNGLCRIIDDMAKDMGFEYFALGHHTRLISDNLLHISNYPSAWAARIVTRAHPSDDPAIVACRNAIVGFLWSDIHRLITLSERQKTFLAESRLAGLGEGFTVPIHLPGECAGSCNFVTAPGRSIPSSVLPATQYVGCLAFEAARRLVRNGDKQSDFGLKQAAPHLSNRQLECIVLAARGKSDTDAGQLLGISNQTVHQHIEAAKRRYGVATRVQLIVLTLFDRQLAFEDILDH
jgi:LuxR family quorum-sensing system transcriptional regulator CciR